jgi:hypothetical protein
VLNLSILSGAAQFAPLIFRWSSSLVKNAAVWGPLKEHGLLTQKLPLLSSWLRPGGEGLPTPAIPCPQALGSLAWCCGLAQGGPGGAQLLLWLPQLCDGLSMLVWLVQEVKTQQLPHVHNWPAYKQELELECLGLGLQSSGLQSSSFHWLACSLIRLLHASLS